MSELNQRIFKQILASNTVKDIAKCFCIHRNAVTRLRTKCKVTGSIANGKRTSRPCPMCIVEKKEAVKAAIEANLSTSIRALAREHEMPKMVPPATPAKPYKGKWSRGWGWRVFG